jgi:hypothetical protein
MDLEKRRITRWQAAPIHLALSVLVAAAVFAVVYFVWYPGALFAGAGGWNLLLLIASVDVTIGPLITLIVFVPGKPGLKFDLAFIAVAQFSALIYGLHVLYESRPAWIVYVKDRFELVRANQIDERERAKAKPPFNALSITGPHLVGAEQPKNPDEQFRIMMTAAQGFDLQTYPQYFVPYDAVRGEVKAHAKPLSQLRELNPREREQVDGISAKVHRPAKDLGFLPLRAGPKDLSVIVDRVNGDFLGTWDLRPWKYT